MTKTKKLFAASLVAFGLGLVATSSFASGPLSPVVPIVPKATVAPVVKSVPVQAKLLNAYRELRTFWLSRAMVR